MILPEIFIPETPRRFAINSFHRLQIFRDSLAVYCKKFVMPSKLYVLKLSPLGTCSLPHYKNKLWQFDVQ